jgi:hypothetical protein
LNITREGLTGDYTSSNHGHDVAATALTHHPSNSIQHHPSAPSRPQTCNSADRRPAASHTYRLSISHPEQPPCLAKPTQDVKIPSHPHYTHTSQPRIEDLGQADPLHSVSPSKADTKSCAGTTTLRPPRRGWSYEIRWVMWIPYGEDGESAPLSSMRITIAMCTSPENPICWIRKSPPLGG